MSSYPLSLFNRDLSLSIDISGSPALVSFPGGVYFAFSGKGTNTTLQVSSYLSYYSIFIGALNTNGSIAWIQNFGPLQTAADCYSPHIAIGNANDLYVTYVTNGSIAGYHPGSYFSPSPGSLPPYGNADVVLARINTVNKTVVWAVQGAGLNGPSNETVPQVAVDITYGWVYLAYQSSGNINPYTATGKTNIIVSCFNSISPSPPGTAVWTSGYQSGVQNDEINCTDYNKNPTIVTDNAGSVYVAYEVTTKAPNGAPVQGQQIELVKFTTTNINTPLNPLYVGRYQWTLSTSGTNIFVSNGKSYQPNLSCLNSTLYLSFLTSGAIPGGNHSPSGNDVVVAAIRTNGNLLWATQGLTNTCPQKYYDVYAVSSTIDELCAPYIVAVVKKFGSRDSVLVWRLNPENGKPTWTYTIPTGASTYLAYGFALTGGKNAVWPSKSYEFTTLSIAAYKGMFYLGYTTLDPIPNSATTITPNHYVGISGLSPRVYAENLSAYNYIMELATGCKCNDSQCGCYLNK